jgi:hypothetical protein
VHDRARDVRARQAFDEEDCDMGSTLTRTTQVGPPGAADPTAFGWGDFSFSWGEHVCAVFENPEQQMAVMVPFVTHGLRAGQRCVWVSPSASASRFRRALLRCGADLPTLEASGQLIIISDVEFYLRDGLFDPDRTLELGLALLEDGQRCGWTAMRVAGEASFLRTGLIDVALWERYEEQVTRCVAGAALVAVCQYDRRRVPSSFIAAALRTHPVVILGETICHSPFFAADVPSVAGRRDLL